MKEKETKRKNNRELQRFDKHLSTGLTYDIYVLHCMFIYIYILCIITTWPCLIIFVNWFWFWNCKFFFVSLKENIINIVAYIYITKNIWILNVEFAQKINIFIELNKYRNYNVEIYFYANYI